MMSNYIHIPLTKEEEEDIDRMFDESSVKIESEDKREEQCDYETDDPGVVDFECVFEKYRRMLETALFEAKQRHSVIRSDWVDILAERSVTQWAKDIEAITLHRFIYILASSIPPTLDSFEELDYYETENMGVYLSTIRQIDREGRSFLYVGSATSERGLKHRIMQHWNENYSRTQAQNGSFHHRLLNQESVPREDLWFIACEAESWFPPGSDAYIYQRKTVVLAEIIYTHWLGGIWKKGTKKEYNLLPICPWDFDTLPWTGCCRFSPLTFPLPGRTNALPKSERMKLARAKQIQKMKNMDPVKKRKLIQERRLKGNRAWQNFVAMRWKKNARLRKERQQPSLEHTTRKCAFCKSSGHTINKCDAPGKDAFCETKWKGRFYHKRKQKDAEKRKAKGAETTSRRTTRPLPRCSICGKQGHNIRTCQDPAAEEFCYESVCSKCLKPGHNAQRCPSNAGRLNPLI